MPQRKPEPFLTLGFAAIDWIEHYLVHGPGDVQGQAIELDDEFAAFIVKAYQVDRKGARKVRRAFLSRAKGRSKSGLAAMIECFEALGPCRFDHWAEVGEVSAWGYEYEEGEPVGAPLRYVECLNVATEEGQAGNTYDAVYYMLNPDTASRELVRDYGKIDVGLSRTTLPNRRGFIEPVTARDTSKDGGKSTFIVADETHLWILPRLKALHGVMTRNLLKRKEASGWMLETSTMYAAGEGSVAEGTHAYADSPAGRSGTLLFDHRQAGDGYDLSKRRDRLAALREAYGPAAAWMNLEAIADSGPWDDPQVTEDEWRRYWLNQPVGLIDTTDPGNALDEADWLAATDPSSSMETVDAFAIEADLSKAWAAIAVAGRRDDGAAHVELLEHRRGTRWIVDRARDLDESHGPAVWVVDGKGPLKDLIPDLEEAGLDVLTASADDVGQAYDRMVDALRDGELRHGPDPELLAAVKAARRKPRGDAGFMFSRRASGADISPIYAASLALWARELETTGPSLW